MINKLLLLGLGGAIGAISRFLISEFIQQMHNGSFPFGTLLVNLAGALIIGFAWGFFETSGLGTNMRLFLFVGILGGFTTFSAFSLETMNLIRDHRVFYAIAYILSSNIGGLMMTIAGFFAARILFVFFTK